MQANTQPLKSVFPKNVNLILQTVVFRSFVCESIHSQLPESEAVVADVEMLNTFG